MTDASGSTAYKYDSRGRLIQERKTIDSVDYATSYVYDELDRPVYITYPTGEIVTNTYNLRGLPNTLGSNALAESSPSNLVTGILYNALGQVTRINSGNGMQTTFSYSGLNGATGDYYGRLREIKTLKAFNTTLFENSNSLPWLSHRARALKSKEILIGISDLVDNLID